MKRLVSFNDMTAFAALTPELADKEEIAEHLEKAASSKSLSEHAEKAGPAAPVFEESAAASFIQLRREGSTGGTKGALLAEDLESEAERAAGSPNKTEAAQFPTKFESNEKPIQDPAVFTTRKLVVVMVGLPARGKTHTAKSLERYLTWLGFSTRVFNVGEHRRETVGTEMRADFFDPRNADAVAARTRIAREVLQEMMEWLLADSHGRVGIYDATNSTRQRRVDLRETLEAANVRVLFYESICTDEKLVERNILENKLRSPDYQNVSEDDAVADFKRRIANYASAYETLDAQEGGAYIQNINASRQMVLNAISGYLPSKIASFLLNSNISTRTLYLSRHGESEWNVTGQLGGDPPLTRRGQLYAIRLAEYFASEFTDKGKDLPQIWTSQLKRTRQTVSNIPSMSICWRALNEIDAGICEGETYGSVKEKYPDLAAARKADKLRFRYPSGESYVDVINRLQPVILEIERAREPILIVAHNAIIRAIYAFLSGKSQSECPLIDIPLHTVYKVIIRSYGCEFQATTLDVESEYNNKTPPS